VRAIHLDQYEAINGIDRGILERLLNASRSADGASTQASQGQRRKTIQTAAAGSLINELIPKFDEDTSLVAELNYFNKNFKAQNGHQDFFPPVALTTVLSGAGRGQEPRTIRRRTEGVYVQTE
jgi:hypothetical protein